MKKIIFAVLSVLSFNMMNAQELSVSKTEYKKNKAESIEMKAQKDVETLHSHLSLNDEQKKQIQAFSVTKYTKISEVRRKYPNGDADAAKRKEELNTVQEEYKNNIKSVLTKEQIEKLNAM